MNFSIKFNTVNSGWSLNVYIDGATGYNFQKNIVLSLKIDIVLANSADPHEMPH